MNQGSERLTERVLLLYPLLLIFGGSLLFYLSFEPMKELLIKALILSLFFYLIHIVWDWTGYSSDQLLLPVAAYLTVTGYIFIYRLDHQLAGKQFWWILAGLVLLVVLTVFLRDYRLWEGYSYLYFWVGLLFLLVTLLMGTEVGGAKSWLELGSFRFQPAEAVKVLLVLFLASYLDLSETKTWGPRGLDWVWWGPLFLMLGMSMLLLAFQRDLGTALIFFVTFLAMLYAANGQWQIVFAGLLIFTSGAVASYYLFDHIQIRVLIWLNPWVTATSSGWQIVQSMFALGSGGLIGSGIGLGRPDLIPAAATDFIFAAVAEEQGFLGSVALVLLYLILTSRGLKIALSAANLHGRLLGFGLTVLLSFQAWLIMGGVIKLLPLTGVTLPFISYGGSSLLVSFVILGLLLNVSHYAEESSKEQTYQPKVVAGKQAG